MPDLNIMLLLWAFWTSVGAVVGFNIAFHCASRDLKRWMRENRIHVDV